ncbi:MAG: sugar phosphate isomerase/epimerase [Lachnospiraceae bacterium]|nr:sugar phosphate isomerase/epimerase [Lachnospiraceae bacterium]
MFQLAVMTGGIDDLFDSDDTYRIIKESGFDGVDANLYRLFLPDDIRAKAPIPAYFRKEADERDVLELVKPLKDAAEKYGLDNYQAHAPFPSVLYDGTDDKEYNDALIEVLRRSVIAAASIDCRNLVIHPFFFGHEAMVSKEEEWELNRRSYLRLVRTAKEYGVTICLENMFRTFHGKRFAATCNAPYEAVSYVDRLNEEAGSKVFGFCLDTGHALLVGQDVKDFMTALGDRIVCFHVHDNNGIEDQHLAPYMGIQDWDRFIEGLAEIGFSRTLSFETLKIWHQVDHELCPEMMKFLAKTGRMFDRRAEELAGQKRSAAAR